MDIRPRSSMAARVPLTLENAKLQLAALQYELIRAESNQTRQDQQSIINWNQALSVAIFAAGLYSLVEHVPSWIPLMMFGVVLPAVLVGGAMAWAGEMVRMERTGAFLRMLERGVWEMLSREEGEQSDAEPRKVDTGWLIWENLLWSPPETMVKAGFRKMNVGYVGIVLFYGVLFLGAITALAAISPPLLSVIVIPLIIAISSALLLPAARHLYRLGGYAPEMSEQELSEWAAGLVHRKSLETQGPVFQALSDAVDKVKTVGKKL